MTNKPNPGFLGSFLIVTIFLTITICTLLIIQYAVKTIWCSGDTNRNTYEHFSNNTQIKEIQQRTNKLRDLIKKIDEVLEILDDSTDATCEITRNIEDNYVKNNSAPINEEEYSLPLEIQKEHQEKRYKRVLKRFQSEKARFSAVKGIPPIYECFTNEKEMTITEAEDELRFEIEEVERLMENTEMKAAALKGQSLESLLAFNRKYLDEAKVLSTVKPIEGFSVSKLTGDALIKKADSLIDKATNLQNAVLKIVEEVKAQKKLSSQIFKVAQKTLS